MLFFPFWLSALLERENTYGSSIKYVRSVFVTSDPLRTYAFSLHPLPLVHAYGFYFLTKIWQRRKVKKLLYKAMRICSSKTPKRALGLSLDLLTVWERLKWIILTEIFNWITHFILLLFSNKTKTKNLWRTDAYNWTSPSAYTSQYAFSWTTPPHLRAYVLYEWPLIHGYINVLSKFLNLNLLQQESVTVLWLPKTVSEF